MNFYEQLFCRGKTTGEGMTHFERLFAAKFGGSPAPEVREYTGAVPVTITADGAPLLDYLISGNMAQSGTPTPDNPIMPEGCGERTENLFDITDLEGGYIDVNTGNNMPNDDQKRTQNYITVQANTTYTLSNYNDKCRIHQYSNNSYLGSVLSDVSPYSFKTNSNCTRIRIAGSKGNFLETIMLNEGSTAKPYVPYGYKIPITSTGQTNNIYLGEVETTRRIKKLVFDGTEVWNKQSSSVRNLYYAQDRLKANALGSLICSHTLFSFDNTSYSADNTSYITTTDRYAIRIDSITTVDDFKNWLQQQYAAGTPVTVWYVLAESETGIVNEPLMRIGSYADTLCMEQASVQIPTNRGNTVIDVLTELKPSEVYIKYMG